MQYTTLTKCLDYAMLVLRTFVFLCVHSVKTLDWDSPSQCEFTKADKVVKCRGLRLTTIPQNLPSDTRSLILDKNEITAITVNDFKSYEHLEMLYLTRNSISHIAYGSFQYQRKLTHLQLDHNKLESLDFYLPESLHSLMVAFNKIKSLHNGMFKEMKFITTLDFSHNDIGHVQPQALKDIEISASQFTLDLSSNSLYTLSVEVLNPVLYEQHHYGKLKVILAHNPIHCNCLLRWLPKIAKQQLSNAAASSVDIQGSCATPHKVKNCQFRDCDARLFNCTLPRIITNEDDKKPRQLYQHEASHFRCDFTGDPRPTIYWIRKDPVLMPPGFKNDRFSVSDGGEIFTIDPVTLEDTEPITCKASSVAGNTTFTFDVSVIEQYSSSQRAFVATAVVLPVILLIFIVAFIVGILYNWRHIRKLWKRIKAINAPIRPKFIDLTDNPNMLLPSRPNEELHNAFMDGFYSSLRNSKRRAILKSYRSQDDKLEQTSLHTTSDYFASIDKSPLLTPKILPQNPANKGELTPRSITDSSFVNYSAQTTPRLPHFRATTQHPYITAKQNSSSTIPAELSTVPLYTDPTDYKRSPNPMTSTKMEYTC